MMQTLLCLSFQQLKKFSLLEKVAQVYSNKGLVCWASVWVFLRWVYVGFKGRAASLLRECCWTHKGTRRHTQEHRVNTEIWSPEDAHKASQNPPATISVCLAQQQCKHMECFQVKVCILTSLCWSDSSVISSTDDNYQGPAEIIGNRLHWCLRYGARLRSMVLLLCCLNRFLVSQTWQQEPTPASLLCAPNSAPWLTRMLERTHTCM